MNTRAADTSVRHAIVVEAPIYEAQHWYFVLLVAAAATVLFALNLLRSRTGRAWRAVHGRAFSYCWPWSLRCWCPLWSRRPT